MRQATKKRAHRLNPILHRLMGQRLMRHRLRWGKDALARASPGLTSLLLLWLLAIYTATSLQHYYGIIPPVLQSIGLFAFQSPPPVFLALTGQLIAVLFAARLSRNTAR
eukprot:scaffold40687_cov20-Tisochrysis_lutea.AAC.1